MLFVLSACTGHDSEFALSMQPHACAAGVSALGGGFVGGRDGGQIVPSPDFEISEGLDRTLAFKTDQLRNCRSSLLLGEHTCSSEAVECLCPRVKRIRLGCVPSDSELVHGELTVGELPPAVLRETPT